MAICLFASSPASATPALDAFRSLLDDGDVKAIEQQAIKLTAAGQPDAVAAYREITEVLLKTTHPERIRTINKWNEAFPSSPHAKTAALWVAIHHLQLEGLQEDYMLRPPALVQYSPAWIEKRDLAINQASEVIALAPDNISALDAWLVTRSWRKDKPDIRKVTARLIDLAPDRLSVLRIVEAYAGFSIQTPRTILETCLKFAKLATDYDADKCVIEHSLPFGAPRDVLDQVIEAVEDVDDPRLDWARLVAKVFYGRLEASDFDELAALHKASLSRSFDLATHRAIGGRLASFTKRPDYIEQANRDLLLALDLWLKDDPYNYNYLEQKLTSHEALGTMGLAGNAWKDTLVFGWKRSESWLLAAIYQFRGGTLTGLNLGTELLEAGAAASEQSILFLMIANNMLNDAIKENEASDTAKSDPICTRFRMARLAEGLCTIHGEQAKHICDETKPLRMAVSEVLNGQPKASCETVANLPMSQLRFPAKDLQLSVDRFIN